MVLDEIEELKGRGRQSQHKPPIRNKHQPLKNLWHKHYLRSGLASMAMNVKRALNKYGMPFVQQMTNEATAAGEKRYITIEHVSDIANDVINGNLGRLQQEQALTGEWLMFVEYQGQRFYLCLATHHKSTHEHIREQIDRVCTVEFPFLMTILEPWSPTAAGLYHSDTVTVPRSHLPNVSARVTADAPRSIAGDWRWPRPGRRRAHLTDPHRTSGGSKLYVSYLERAANPWLACSRGMNIFLAGTTSSPISVNA